MSWLPSDHMQQLQTILWVPLDCVQQYNCIMIDGVNYMCYVVGEPVTLVYNPAEMQHSQAGTYHSIASKLCTEDWAEGSTASGNSGNTLETRSDSQSEVGEDDKHTTVMIRNIPQDISRARLLDMLDNKGLLKYLDFLYMPRSFKDNFRPFGYVFMNFTTHEYAVKAKNILMGFENWQSSEKIIQPCDTQWARPLQGLDAHLQRYRNSPVMSESVPDECKPILLREGLRVPFPPPTKQLRGPRRRELCTGVEVCAVAPS